MRTELGRLPRQPSGVGGSNFSPPTSSGPQTPNSPQRLVGTPRSPAVTVTGMPRTVPGYPVGGVGPAGSLG